MTNNHQNRARLTGEALPTLTTANTQALITREAYGLLQPAFLTQFRDRVRDLDPATEHLPTIVGDGANHALLTPYYSASETARPADQPVGTLTTRDRYALVMRNNTGGAEMTTPISETLRTLTSAGHQSLITADDITDAQVDECYFRMLEPREIGSGMAFDRDYKVLGTRRDQVRGYGNAVTPPAARDLVACVAESMGAAA